MNIEDLPKGALPDPVDERDFKIEVVGALPPIDWNKSSNIPHPRHTDQGSSDACGPHATTKYHEQLTKKIYSIRDLSARVLLPDYGSYARDNIMAIVNQGQATNDEVSDPSPQTPRNMRDKTGVTPEKEQDDKARNGFVIDARDVETVGRAISAYEGVVLGIYGTNEGWQDIANPRPPKPGETIWGHMIYAFDWHMHNGQKCIICASNWPQADEHHIKENYFLSGYTFNPWTLIPQEQYMFKNLKVKIITNSGESYGVYTQTPNTDLVTKAEDEAEWRSYSKPDSYAVHTVNADNSTDWSVDETINLKTN